MKKMLLVLGLLATISIGSSVMAEEVITGETENVETEQITTA